MSRPEKSMLTELARLKEMEERAKLGGGADKLTRQRQLGKLTCRERLNTLLDPGSFVELNMMAEHQCRDFGMDKKRFLGDGVVTGHGLLESRQVFVFSEDATVLGGSTGRIHGAKIHYVMRLARELGVPLIGLYDSAGARIQEGMDNVYGITGMFLQNSLNSGVVPQLAAIMGSCTGGSVYSPALCDFVFQVEGTAHAFITGPAVIKEVTGEVVDFENLGGAKVHSEKSGVAHFTAPDDAECLQLMRRLLSFLPQNSREKPSRKSTSDPPDRKVPELMDLVPINLRKSYDMKQLVRIIVDDGDFFEVQERYARNMIIGFARLNGWPVGIVANQPQALAGTIDINAADKASRFIRFCDAFNISLITLVDTPGFLPGVSQEYNGIIRHGAKMLYVWVEATVPKVACIIRKSYGGATPAMGLHEIGFDQVLCWPSAELQVLGAEAAVNILYGKEIKEADDPEFLRQKKIEEYRHEFLNPYHPASRMVLDAIIDPAETRYQIIRALEILSNKTSTPRSFRKHGNMPF